MIRLQQPRAFTLIELLVVVAIIGVLAVLLLPGANRAIGQSKTAKCAAHLGQWGKAYLMYTQDNDGYLPNVLIHQEPNWQEAIAPYLVSGTSSTNSTLRFTMRTKYGCPLDNKDSVYGNNEYLDPGTGGYNHAPSHITLIHNGLNIAVIADSYVNFWTVAPSSTSSGISYRHTGGKANFWFLDDHVETLTYGEATNRPVLTLPPNGF